MAPRIAAPSRPRRKKGSASHGSHGSHGRPHAALRLLQLCLGLWLLVATTLPLLARPTALPAQPTGPDPAAETVENGATLPVEVDPRKRLTETFDQAYDRLMVLVSYLPLLAVSLLVLAVFFWLSRWIAGRDFLFARLGQNRFARDLGR